MSTAIQNALNFYISGEGNSSNAHVDLVLTSQTTNGFATGLDFFLRSEATDLDNSMNLFIQSNSIGDVDNFINLYTFNSNPVSSSLDFGMFYYGADGVYGTMDDEWGDLDVFWGTIGDDPVNPLDARFNLVLKGNWFYSLDNSLNFYIKRNENSQVFFTLKTIEGETNNSLPFYMNINATLNQSVEMSTTGIGVNNARTNLYTHGF